MSEPQPTDSTTDVMRYWVGLLRQLGEDVCTWMALVEALKAQAERDRAVIEAARAYLKHVGNNAYLDALVNAVGKHKRQEDEVTP